MLSPTRVIVMAFFFTRYGRVRGFQLLPRYWNRHEKHQAIREYPASIKSRCNSPLCLSYKRRFSSAENNVSQVNDEAIGISPELQSCVLKFVTDGSLSLEESRSISNALFRSPFGRNLVGSKNTGKMKDIMHTSIDSYLTQRKKRAEVGREAILNPGSYIRSIVKKEVESIDEKPVVAVSEQSSLKSKHQLAAIDRKDAIGVSGVRELLRLKYIGPDELNESCLHALSQYPAFDANYALETYVKQKERRKGNSIEMISNPSSYVIAVLRNASKERPPTDNDPSKPSSFSIDVHLKASHSLNNEMLHLQEQHMAEEVSPEMETEISPCSPSINTTLKVAPETYDVNMSGPKKSVATLPAEDSTITSSMSGSVDPRLKPYVHDRKSTITRHADDARTNSKIDSPKVTMEYVDKCLDILYRLEQPVNVLPGVGLKTAQSLNKLGLFTLRDLMWYFPRSFIDRSVLQGDIRNTPDGELGTFALTVNKEKARHNAVPCVDEEGNTVDVVFIYGRSRQGLGMTSAAITKLCSSDKMIVSGKVKYSEDGYAVFNPDIIEAVNNATDVLGINPVYRLNSGLTQNKLVKIIEGALSVAEELRVLPESLPRETLDDLGWPNFIDAIKLSHKPESMGEAGVNSPARNRLAFEEMCIQQAQLALTRWDMKLSGVEPASKPDPMFPTWRDSPLVSNAIDSLPFELTQSQYDCLDEIWDDINKHERMTRLLQGDVGSGKTVLSYLAGLGCIESRQGGGSVVAFLAPTQLLALQHYQTIFDFAHAYSNQNRESLINNVQVELLTGSITGSKREEVIARLENAKDSDAVFLIGTHALVTSDVVERLGGLSLSKQSNRKGLALLVVDEEQRFGVRQREALASCAANTLFISATPIPRTLALYGSGVLDVTNLESEPRQVKTTITTADNLDKVIAVLRNKINNGSKCFWVLPRIGEHETHGDADTDGNDHNFGKSSVLDRYAMLKDFFDHESIGLVHGRMSIKDREEQLAKFADPSSPTVLLVSTTVIEVGIDIPNVDILIVENAERFGLSALHQLRGRIGRKGSNNVDCHAILLSEEEHFNATNGASASLKRLDILRENMCGQKVAEADLYLRGPGDLLGNAQSGLYQGRVVDACHHWELLSAATVIGRAFLEVQAHDAKCSDSESSCLIIDKLRNGDLRSFYDQTNASYEKGFALRFMMTLFATCNSGALRSTELLTKLSEARDPANAADDKEVQQKIASLLQSLPDVSIPSVKAKRDEDNDETSSATAGEKTCLPLSVSTDRVNLAGDDVVFIVLDVETTGLSDKTDHVIQIAAKVLGSSDPEDLFSQYILPPIDKIPDKIEELTGITDSFLRFGGYDTLGTELVGPARGFEDVFSDFQAFCKGRAKGKKLVMIAHNARFDRMMLESELRRLRSSRTSEDTSFAITLSEVFDSSVDSLSLFRDRRMWTLSLRPKPLRKPDTLKLGSIYQHVFHESMEFSHNAIGDILALDRLLMERDMFYGWMRIAHELQRPFSRVQ